jgi:hypothetical protein
VTGTFYYFDSEEEFKLMMSLIENSELQDSSIDLESPANEEFNDFDCILEEIQKNANPDFNPQLQEVDF